MHPKPLAALLFDLDGTLVDTDALHFKAWNAVLARIDRRIDIEYYRTRIMGAANDAIMRGLLPDSDPADWPSYTDAKEAHFRASVGELEPARGALDLIAWAEDRKLKMAVVTNAPRPNAELMLGAIGLAARLPKLVIGDELAKGKPDPLPYLTALELIGASADESLAFEDSGSGVQSAARAGLFTFGMLTALPEETLRAKGANAVIKDFTEQSLWSLLKTRCA